MLSSAVHPLTGIDLDIRFGRPCITGTRISVRDVLGRLDRGMSVAEIMEDFPELTLEVIKAVQAYAANCSAASQIFKLPINCSLLQKEAVKIQLISTSAGIFATKTKPFQ